MSSLAAMTPGRSSPLPDSEPGSSVVGMVSDSSRASSSSSDVRRRLIRKQKPPPAFCSPLPVAEDESHPETHTDWDDSAEIMWSNLPEAAWKSLSDRERYNRVYGKYYFWRRTLASPEHITGLGCANSASSSSSAIPPAQAKQTPSANEISSFLEQCRAPVWVAQWSADRSGQVVVQGDRVPRAKAFLFTWNGPWGLIDDIAVNPEQSVEDVVAMLQGHEKVLALWQSLRSLVSDVAKDLKLNHFAVSLELCTDSLTGGVCRVHAHAYAKASELLCLTRKYVQSRCMFEKSKPNISPELPVLRNRGKADNAGMYYLLCPRSVRSSPTAHLLRMSASQ